MEVVMEFLHAYATCVLGVIISFLLPVLKQTVTRAWDVGGPASLGGVERWLRLFWRYAKPYIALMLFALVTAIVLVILLQPTSARESLLIGLAWQSGLQQVQRS
jgi:hypothetical protein